MFKRSLDEWIELIDGAFTKALEAEGRGKPALAQAWLDKAIEYERQALA